MTAVREVVANPLADLDLARLRTRTCAKWGYYPDDVLPLWVAEMDAYVAPQIKEAVAQALDNGDTGYPWGQRYAEALASFAAERWGWSLDPAMTTQVTDVMSGVRELVRAISAADTPVVVTPPVYPPFFSVSNLLSRPIVTAPLTAEGRLDPATLEAAFAEATSGGKGAILIISNPHNPTGVVHSRTELETVARLARQYGVRVISDEIHSPLVMPTSTLTPYLSVANTGPDFAVVSASKGWNLAGFKAALVIAGADAAETLHTPDMHSAHAGHIAVIAHTAAFNHARDWLDAVIAGVDANRRLLVDLLATQLPGAVYRQPESTYLAWIDFRPLELGDDPAELFLERAKVALSSGMGYGEQGAGHARINLATSPAILEEAVTRMGTAIG